MNEQKATTVLALPERMRDLPERPLAPVTDSSPTAIAQLLLRQGGSIEVMREVLKMQYEHEARQARNAYAAAMTTFKRNPPKIIKDKHVAFQTSKGVTEYDHATLGQVCAQIIAGLSEVGISHRWDTNQPEGGMIEVTCVLTHEFGHSESTTLKAGRDDSGGKNNIQQLASTVTYLQRYTLLAATGLATNDYDDDGRGSEAPPAAEAAPELTNEQHAALQAIKEADTLDACKAAWQAAKKLAKTDKAPHVEKLANVAANARRAALGAP